MLTRRAVLATGAASAGLAACGQADRPLYAADAQAVDYPTTKAVEEMGRLLDERTGGRIRFKVFGGGQLGPERDTLEMTMFGGLDLNRINTAPLNPIAPETLVPALPFVFRSVAHMRAAMDGEAGKRILESLEPHGLKGLCYYDSGARSFYNGRRPVAEPGDLRGLKIRVQNSDLYVSMVEALGANATPMSFSEVYGAIAKRVVDGAENNWPSYYTTRHFEVAPYYTLTEHVMAPEVLVMSMRRWRKLSNEDKALVQQAALDSVPFMRNLWDARVAEAKAAVAAAGNEVIEIADKTPFQARMEPVYDRFVTPKLRPLVEAIQATEVPLA